MTHPIAKRLGITLRQGHQQERSFDLMREAYYDLLSAEQERTVFLWLRQAEADGNVTLVAECEDFLMRANLRLSRKMALQYRGRLQLDVETLTQYASLGLLTAIRKYDVSRGTRFSTMAVPWIRNAMQRESEDEAYTLSLPTCALEPHRAHKRSEALKRSIAHAIASPIFLSQRVGNDDRTVGDVLLAPQNEPETTNDVWLQIERVIPDADDRELLRRAYGFDGAPQNDTTIGKVQRRRWSTIRDRRMALLEILHAALRCS
jgi:RNA polymerase sigma factor (sigma-70 family)